MGRGTGGKGGGLTILNLGPKGYSYNISSRIISNLSGNFSGKYVKSFPNRFSEKGRICQN
jgi:hypothetical protein